MVCYCCVDKRNSVALNRSQERCKHRINHWNKETIASDLALGLLMNSRNVSTAWMMHGVQHKTLCKANLLSPSAVMEQQIFPAKTHTTWREVYLCPDEDDVHFLKLESGWVKYKCQIVTSLCLIPLSKINICSYTDDR